MRKFKFIVLLVLCILATGCGDAKERDLRPSVVLEDLKNKLIETVTHTDFNEVEQDIKNFVEDQNIITFIKNNGKSYLLEQIEKR